MAHKLLKVTQKLYGVPHLISETSFENIHRYLEKRNMGMMDFPPQMPEVEVETEVIGGIGIIEIEGPLTYKSTGFEAICGGCSYEDIIEEAEELIEEGVTTLVLNFDSGGGEAYGVFSMSDELRKLCNENNVKLVAYVDGLCASAAYAIACVCDEVITNPYSEVGSIGVLICATDRSKALEMEGIKPVYIYAGDSKIPYADDGSFKPEFLDDLQMKVDSLYESFVGHVSKYTGLSSEAVKATEAKTFLAQDALAIGLVNKIMTNSEFIEYVIELNKRG